MIGLHKFRSAVGRTWDADPAGVALLSLGHLVGVVDQDQMPELCFCRPRWIDSGVATECGIFYRGPAVRIR